MVAFLFLLHFVSIGLFYHCFYTWLLFCLEQAIKTSILDSVFSTVTFNSPILFSQLSVAEHLKESNDTFPNIKDIQLLSPEESPSGKRTVNPIAIQKLS